LISEVQGRFSRSTSTHVSNSGVDFPSRLFANPWPPNPLYVTFSSNRHDPHLPLLYNAGSDHLSVHDQPCSNKKFLVIRPPQRCSVKGANRFAGLSRRSFSSTHGHGETLPTQWASGPSCIAAGFPSIRPGICLFDRAEAFNPTLDTSKSTAEEGRRGARPPFFPSFVSYLERGLGVSKISYVLCRTYWGFNITTGT
jgi:hypothetical protein